MFCASTGIDAEAGIDVIDAETEGGRLGGGRCDLDVDRNRLTDLDAAQVGRRRVRDRDREGRRRRGGHEQRGESSH